MELVTLVVTVFSEIFLPSETRNKAYIWSVASRFRIRRQIGWVVGPQVRFLG